ncbi:alpha/beta-hydrolase [Byssothecium circinans]|uniref:Alpha/beta-hydrolase n=1 Tax=Byssothecium circinans TaxID=147558 RepID=A0A6A5TXS9_9PLEO|nr:alpha/beta-hydrolase [Byssothecium circinans]
MHPASTILNCFVLGVANAALTRVSNFGSNPSGIQMWIDVPANVPAKAPILVGAKRCYSHYPSSTHDLLCWDAGTKKSLIRDGGGDSQSIVQMVDYALSKYSADPTRVFVVGTSSGSMMGNVLAAVYPDVFAAASVYSGVAAGCMAVPDGTPPNPYDPCGLGRLVKTPQQWGDIHGTSDTTVAYQNFIEDLKQWSNVHGVAFAKNTTNTPDPNYTQMTYGDGTKLTGYSARGVGHVVPLHPTQALSFFGLESMTRCDLGDSGAA